MTFLPSLLPRFEHICLFADFPATCFRFEPGLGVQELNLGPRKSSEGGFFIQVFCAVLAVQEIHIMLTVYHV